MNALKFSKILIVNDDKKERQFIKNKLKQNGIGVFYHEAKNGEEAIKKYVAYKPHLIIMDILMDHMDGITAAGIIMKHDPNARIILITEKENGDIQQMAMKKSGAIGFVLKSANTAELLKTISIELTAQTSERQEKRMKRIASLN